MSNRRKKPGLGKASHPLDNSTRGERRGVTPADLPTKVLIVLPVGTAIWTALIPSGSMECVAELAFVFVVGVCVFESVYARRR